MEAAVVEAVVVEAVVAVWLLAVLSPSVKEEKTYSHYVESRNYFSTAKHHRLRFFMP